jgi:two-component system phosphate regulon response regulator PhoB
MPQKVLARFDDAQLFLFVRHLLAVEGFEVVLAADYDADAQPTEVDYVALVIDAANLALPESLIEIRRSFPRAALVVLSKDNQGFEDVLGCDDLLLTRPFDPPKLVRFLRRLRYRGTKTGSLSEFEGAFKFADLEMNLARMQVLRAGVEVPLTPLQFKLLRHMLERPAEACSRDEFIEHCWPDNAEVEPRTVDIHLGHIRRTLKRFGPDLIRTVRGAGYALRAPGEAQGDEVRSSDG